MEWANGCFEMGEILKRYKIRGVGCIDATAKGHLVWLAVATVWRR